ncbi:MAG TPA: hypothetical protein VGK06_04480 [Methanosarcina sp.]
MKLYINSNVSSKQITLDLFDSSSNYSFDSVTQIITTDTGHPFHCNKSTREYSPIPNSGYRSQHIPKQVKSPFFRLGGW